MQASQLLVTFGPAPRPTWQATPSHLLKRHSMTQTFSSGSSSSERESAFAPSMEEQSRDRLCCEWAACQNRLSDFTSESAFITPSLLLAVFSPIFSLSPRTTSTSSPTSVWLGLLCECSEAFRRSSDANHLNCDFVGSCRKKISPPQTHVCRFHAPFFRINRLF